MSEPTDLGTRLAQVLREGAEGAPDASGLADAARGRARARRRARTTVAAVVAAAAIAVPVAVVVSGGDGGGAGDDAEVAGDPTREPSTALSPQGRWESWRGVTVQVPDEWQPGNQSTWCAGGGSAEQFLVTRPGDITEMILCVPASSYGLSFQDVEMADGDQPFDWPVVTQTGQTWPEGTYVGAHGEDGVLVTVAGPDREQVAEILGTVTAYAGADPHGCGARLGDVPSPPVDAAGPPRMSVCRYGPDGALQQSELLVDADAVAAGEALDRMRQGELDCAPSPGRGPTIVMSDGTREVTIELDGACTVAEGTPSGIVGPDVLWWALSPGFAGELTGLGISVLRSHDPADR